MNDRNATMDSSDSIPRYHSGMTQLLAGLLHIADEMERWLDVPIDGESARASLRENPRTGLYLSVRQLLCKARLHGIAVVRANEACNMHSLAVQMRPVLECAGQLATILKNLTDEPQRGFASFLRKSRADYYQTLIRTSQGQLSHEELLDGISSMNERMEVFADQVKEGGGLEVRKAAARKPKRFRQLDKVAPLPEGDAWYRYLSNHYCHADIGSFEEPSQPDTRSTEADQWKLACAQMADYVANRIAEMISCTALCAAHKDADESRAQAAMKQLEAVRAKTAELRDRAFSSTSNATTPGDPA